MLVRLSDIINTVRVNKGLRKIKEIKEHFNLREDLNFDSLDLAELTVRVEKEFGVDVFEDGFVVTVSDVLDKLKNYDR